MYSYHKISQSYHEESNGVYDGHIIIEEKIDGSQLRIEILPDGTITVGSHKMDGVTVDSMFRLGVESAQRIFANYKPEVKMTIFCEYLSKPKQNSIPYANVPLNNIILFDVKRDTLYIDRPQKELFAKQHGLEIVPLLWSGQGSEIVDKDNPNIINEAFKEELLKKQSILGHQGGFDRIEGFVVKNYDKMYDTERYRSYERSTHPFISIKIVNEAFKEKNKEENPTNKESLQKLKEMYRTEARYDKAIQHLREKGEITDQIGDLKFLIPEVKHDLIEEEKEGIKDALWKLFGGEIVGYAVKGMPEHYKKRLEEINS